MGRAPARGAVSHSAANAALASATLLAAPSMSACTAFATAACSSAWLAALRASTRGVGAAASPIKEQPDALPLETSLGLVSTTATCCTVYCTAMGG
jgi:hypothetical protein